ncbi:hypothetical protein DFQ27_003137 [Actinomortierella ambigua]|uniref:MTHFR SAM-binding regulatory domain-containing protein n=1 Tax=Actinomortierella ambigua TaxID=1343610 RepID=A0A9P6Q5I0_9FUNG|nr:hypothetical protein DFQ27_003137 [Actinomortierella ambigua]
MKITAKINELTAEGKPYYSFEYFPPKTAQGMSNLFDRMGRMQALSPSFITCTWGAGGSTFDKTTELCAVAQTVHGFETCMHLTCTNMDRGKVDEALSEAKQAGIQNILALRGDPPRGQEYWSYVDDSFVHAVDLVRYIRQQYGDYFCIGVAGYPEGHMDSTHDNPDQEIIYLKEKVDAGADFVLTQLFYDVEGFLAWEKRCRAFGITCPIIPCIMPIQSYHGFRRITNLAKVHVPASLLEALEPLKNDDQKVKDYGVDLAARMIDQLREAGVKGFHICTLNLERSVRLILEKVGFVAKTAGRTHHVHGQNTEPTNPSIIKNVDENDATVSAAHLATFVHEGSEHPGVDTQALKPLIWKPAPDDITGRSETWDDFPNGRWGDARSPAFGDLDGYGISLKVEPRRALELWGRPNKADNITKLFVDFIEGRLPALPWSEEAPLPETDAIRERLVTCNKRGYWTVGSQPAVDGKSSADPLVGWGPKGGYVYQKAFVELFVGPDEVAGLVQKLRKTSPWITFFAASRDGAVVTNASGDVETEQRKIAELKKVCGRKDLAKDSKKNKDKEDASAKAALPSTGSSPASSEASGTSTPAPDCDEPLAFTKKNTPESLIEGPNAVTWGVFPGKEIVQPTVIEQVSFQSWRDEAFEIWREWEHLYPKGSDSQKLLHQIGHDYWLFNIVHNDFRDPDGVWEAILN